MLISKIEWSYSLDPGPWDELALKLGGGFFLCHAHARLESQRSNTKPLFGRFRDESGKCVALAQAVIESPRLWPFARFCKKAVLDALPIAAGDRPEIQQEALAALESELRKRGVFLIRVNSYDSPHGQAVLSSMSYKLENLFEFYLDLTPPEEEIWRNLRDTRRNKIRKAEKAGLVTKIEKNAAAVELLYGFQKLSLKRRGVDFQAGCPAESVKDMLLDKDRGELFVTYKDDIPLNASLFVFFGERAYYHSSGASAEGNKLAGPAHLLWTAIKHFKQKGAKVFNFGGVPAPADENDPSSGLYSFKRDFGAGPLAQPAGEKIISRFGCKLFEVLTALKNS
jgi:hypothetical protein